MTALAVAFLAACGSAPADRAADAPVAAASTGQEVPETLATSLLGSWDVAVDVSTGNHHARISGAGHVRFDTSGCALDLRVETFLFAPGALTVDPVAYVLRSGGPGLLWRATDEGGHLAWGEGPEVASLLSPLAFAPVDVAGLPSAGICGLGALHPSGGSWPVAELTSNALEAGRRTLVGLAGPRGECVDLWAERLTAAAGDSGYDELWLQAAAYEVEVSSSRVEFTQSLPTGGSVAITLTRTPLRSLPPVSAMGSFSAAFGEALASASCDDLFVRFLAD